RRDGVCASRKSGSVCTVPWHRAWSVPRRPYPWLPDDSRVRTEWDVHPPEGVSTVGPSAAPHRCAMAVGENLNGGDWAVRDELRALGSRHLSHKSVDEKYCG